MTQNTTHPALIEKFRMQRQRMKKLLIVFVMGIAIMVLVPLVLAAFPTLHENPFWKTFGTAWICFFGIACAVLGIAALFNQMCPACGKFFGEEFWMVHYCSRCGAQLTDD